MESIGRQGVEKFNGSGETVLAAIEAEPWLRAREPQVLDLGIAIARNAVDDQGVLTVEYEFEFLGCERNCDGTYMKIGENLLLHLAAAAIWKRAESIPGVWRCP